MFGHNHLHACPLNSRSTVSGVGPEDGRSILVEVDAWSGSFDGFDYFFGLDGAIEVLVFVDQDLIRVGRTD
jgi:hypothetical protein